ncbi:hypothetical protein [Streptomyces sp. Z423-1]|uniref:hypothetical protein n=1 Tax=Streptomyces sp. Z423-1 TaxID=2730915 RepID=UPI001F0F1D80|nr:hypothetical protein [Streptomyces sp. Z423-1]
MTDVHQRDLSGAPSSLGAWDARSEQCLTTEPPADPAPQRTQRRGPADPVKALMHRHRDLCERAVDPLEIAAGLEAHGITDRTAARYRHKDVFSLAEEMFARIPHDNDTPTPPHPPPPPAPTPPGSSAPSSPAPPVPQPWPPSTSPTARPASSQPLQAPWPSPSPCARP